MSSSIFLTGATGFVGRRTVACLADRGDVRLVCLTRSGLDRRRTVARSGAIRWVRGDLAEPAGYQRELAGCDTTIHLAAATGRASRAEFRRVNVAGTDSLLEACRREGVRRLVHVSTIAVHFDDLDGYPYAASKAEAENLVRASGLEHTIVRPTVVLGGNGPAWRTLEALARLPVVVVPGDGEARIQPLHVDDLARVLAGLGRGTEPPTGAHDLGGPQSLSVRALLGRIHRRLTGRPPRFLHLPLRPLVTGVAVLDRLLPIPPPVVPGQLSTFHRDGRVREGALQHRVRGSLADVDETIERCVREGHDGRGAESRA